MAQLITMTDTEIAGSEFFARLIPSGHNVSAPRVRQPVEIIERKMSVVNGLNEAARNLNVSRSHLSLVMHGKRFSRVLLNRLYAEYGWRPGGAATLEVAANIKRVSLKAVK